MLAYAEARGLPSHVLLSKCDKLGRNEARRTLAAAREALAGRAGVQLFSAESGEGLDAARRAMEAMLSGHVKMPGGP
jgi:GTP-binding protein